MSTETAIGVPSSWLNDGVESAVTAAKRHPICFCCNENSDQLEVALSYHCSDEPAP